MTTLDSFKLELKDEHKMVDSCCRHGKVQNLCIFWKKFWIENDSDKHFREVLSRARMFSPSSCIKNIKEFKNNILESRKAESLKISTNRSNGNQNKDRIDYKTHDKIKVNFSFDSNEIEVMQDIHNHLISRTSKLVEKVKKSRYGGFFSPHGLRNRIMLGNFSQLPWSPEVIKRRALSPREKLMNFHKVKTPICQNERKIESKNILNSTRDVETTNRNSFRFESIRNQLLNNSKISRLKSIAEKYKNIERNKILIVDDEYFKTQHKLKSNFSF